MYEARCPQCRDAIAPQDVTCPRCGAIIDRFSFSIISRDSLAGESREAFARGSEACGKQIAETGKSEIQAGEYRPPAGFETAYRAGWQRTADQWNAKKDRGFGRRRGMRVFWSGVAPLVAGSAVWASLFGSEFGRVALGTNLGGVLLIVIGGGAVAVLSGIVMMITGDSDEVRPDA